MALRMAQPWQHPKTGVFWFRRAVPSDLRARVGKSEELKSLGTKDAAEARVRHAKLAAEVEARWASLRAGSRSLTERDAHALARSVHDTWIRWHGDEPSTQLEWQPHLYAHLWTRRLPADAEEGQPTVSVEDLQLRAMRRFCIKQADDCLAHHGFTVGPDSHFKLAKAIGAAFQRASTTLDLLSEGVLAPEDVPALATSTPYSALVAPPHSTGSRPSDRGRPDNAKPFSISGLFEAWWREAQAAGRKPSTHESYQNTVKSFIAFLRHDDASRVTAEDVVAFKDHRLSTPSQRTGRIPSAKTVKDSDLSALKTLFGWAVMNRRLPANPASGITIKVGRKPQVRPKGFTEDEARAILSAASAYVPGSRELPQTAAAKRWIPWLCAFSGARVGEIGQLRRQDVRHEGDLWVLRVTPEAGTVKTNQARDVVLHQQLLDLGFPAFIEAAADGPLFLVAAEDGDVLGPLAGLLNRMREFVRPIVTDANVQPNHGWRHLFTTMCIDAEIEARVYNAIQGHAGRTVADHYGDVTLRAKAAAIRKLPPFRTS